MFIVLRLLVLVIQQIIQSWSTAKIPQTKCLKHYITCVENASDMHKLLHKLFMYIINSHLS